MDNGLKEQERDYRRKTETQKVEIKKYYLCMHTHVCTSIYLQVQKFVILKNDLSIPGGELGERAKEME